MKQTIYVLKHQAANADVWMRTIAASPDPLENLAMEIMEKGKKTAPLEAELFDNLYFPVTNSPYIDHIQDGFSHVGDTHNMRGSSTGPCWCLTSEKDHPEVKAAWEEYNKKQQRQQAEYYSRPWV